MSKADKYIINFKKVLGSGATAKVYLGINSKDGCQYAIKCSKRGDGNAAQMLKEEMKTLKLLDSNYIIKCYEGLENFQRYAFVLIMEYCNKTSVYEFTELHQGLCDNMFLKMLECLHHGIYHLREKNIVHRDIKPGNMMVHQDKMGYYHVKIVDLGTAKMVCEDQQFKTICGTPEYLHPDMFIQYLGKAPRMPFNSNVDLWSTGITLYHAATTQLPFQPIRSNIKYHDILNDMYFNKKPGIISGKQMSSKDDDIIWSNSLPHTCRMSPMLKGLASKLIGSLMELSDANTYDRFYKEAEQISTKQRILVFNSLNGELLVTYVDSLTYSCVVNQISESIGYAKEDLIMMTKNKVLAPLVDPNAECLRPMPVKGHLRYELTDDTVLVVVKKLPLQTHPLAMRNLLNSECQPPNDSYTYFIEVKKYAQVLMRSIYQLGYGANYIDCQVECYLATMFALNQYVLVDELRLMHEVLPWQMVALKSSCSMTESLIDLAEETIDHIQSYTDVYNSLTQCRKEISRLNEKSETNVNRIGTYYKKFVEQKEMFKYTDEKFYKVTEDDIVNDNLDFLVHLSEELVNELKMFPEKRFNEDKFQESVDYKLEIWERHIRLYQYYQLANSRFIEKKNRIIIVHNFFDGLLRKGLDLMGKIESWKAPVTNVEERRQQLASDFCKIVSWWKDIESPQENGTLKSRILEIKNLVEQLTGISPVKDA